jgi:C4-dicarboxylate-specific signal transduction histidine kinase
MRLAAVLFVLLVVAACARHQVSAEQALVDEANSHSGQVALDVNAILRGMERARLSPERLARSGH